MFHVFRAGSTGFKLYVRTSRPLKRDEIEEVSKLLGEDINMYGPLEIGDREVTLVRKPEVVPSTRNRKPQRRHHRAALVLIIVVGRNVDSIRECTPT